MGAHDWRMGEEGTGDGVVMLIIGRLMFPAVIGGGSFCLGPIGLNEQISSPDSRGRDIAFVWGVMGGTLAKSHTNPGVGIVFYVENVLGRGYSIKK